MIQNDAKVSCAVRLMPKRPSVLNNIRQIIPHTIITLTLAWKVVIWQEGCMDSCCLLHILILSSTDGARNEIHRTKFLFYVIVPFLSLKLTRKLSRKHLNFIFWILYVLRLRNMDEILTLCLIFISL